MSDMTPISYWSNFEQIFPYESIRQDQFDLLEKMLSAPDNSRIILEASTGSGKTVAALVSLMTRLQQGQSIIIFTRTINQMEPFLREWSRIIRNSTLDPTEYIMLPVIGKSKLCRIEEQVKQKTNSYNIHRLCKSLPVKIEGNDKLDHKKGNPCPYFPGRNGLGELKKTNRENDLAYSIAKNFAIGPFTISNLKNKVEQTGQCPYYGLRSILHHARILILPHYYLAPGRLEKVEKTLKFSVEDSLVIVDEAHHLLEYNILKFTEKEINELYGLYGNIAWLLYIKSMFSEMKGQVDRSRIFPNGLFSVTRLFQIRKRLKQIGDSKIMTEIDHPAFEIIKSMYETQQVGIFVKKQDTIRFIEYSPKLRLNAIKRARMVIFQSATFYNLRLIKTAFQMPDAITHSTSTIRSSQEFRAYLYSVISSKYERRTDKIIDRIVETVGELHQCHTGTTLIFVPSYEFLDQIGSKLLESEILPVQSIITETVDARESDLNEAILTTSQAVVLGNSGGKLAEGNEWLKNGISVVKLVIMAGLPYNPIDPDDRYWLEVFRNEEFHFRSKSMNVKKMTHIIPIMIAIEQCYGRAIRSSKDKAALVVLDFRAEQFQRELNLRRYSSTEKLTSDLKHFYE